MCEYMQRMPENVVSRVHTTEKLPEKSAQAHILTSNQVSTN